MLKYSSKATTLVSDLVYYLDDKPKESIYQNLNDYLHGSIAYKNPEYLAQKLVALWEQEPDIVENFLEAQMKKVGEVAAASLSRQKIEKLVAEIEAIK